MTSPQQPRMVSEFASDPDMAELIELFVNELPERVSALNQAWSTKQITDLKRLSHQLKGACAGYGFPTIGKAAGTLEASLKNLDPVAGSIEGLAAQFRELVDLCARASKAA